MVSVAKIDMWLPQSDGQEMTSSVPVAMETWGEGRGGETCPGDLKRLLETMTFYKHQATA